MRARHHDAVTRRVGGGGERVVFEDRQRPPAEWRAPSPPLPDQMGGGAEPREAGTAAEGRGKEVGCKQARPPAVTPSVSTYARRPRNG